MERFERSLINKTFRIERWDRSRASKTQEPGTVRAFDREQNVGTTNAQTVLSRGLLAKGNGASVQF